MYDRGMEYACSEDCAIGVCDCNRWLEIWNLVFMQYNRDEEGNLTPLPRPSIDTGMGLERLTSVLQGKDSNFDTDLFIPIIKQIEKLTGKVYDPGDAGFPFRVIADHSRACTFLIADGVLPSNDGRGYVLRRILRRAVRFGKVLGIEEPFLYKNVDVVSAIMSEAYPELLKKSDFVRDVIRMEEERFFVTLHEGMRKVEEILLRTRQQGAEIISGEDAFMMYDTYGFPLDLMEDVANENGFEVDTEGFRNMMEKQRDRARSANKGENAFAQDRILAELLAELPATFFSGYDCQEDQSQVIALLIDNEKVNEAYGKEIILVTAVTPFYAQSGGQIADIGIIKGQNGILNVTQVHKIADWILHYGELDGKIAVGEQVVLTVHRQRRLDTARNHTATHLLHRALRKVLGEHAQQKGSLVEPERLRFDFSHLAAVTEEELSEIETLVNEAIWSMHEVSKVVKSLDEARDMGAVALFGEKYGDQVRVVSVGDISMELCGGTHVNNTGEIGLFKLLSEGSVGSGLRRIEAVTGRYALDYFNAVEKELKSIAAVLRVTPTDAVKRVEQLNKNLREKDKEIETLKSKASQATSEDIISQAVTVGDVKTLIAVVSSPDTNTLRQNAEMLRDKLGSSLVLLGAVIGDRVAFACFVSKDLVSRGLHAGNIVALAAKVTGGGGGGRPDMAQAGGKEIDKLELAMDEARKLVEKTLQ